jgi:hypothetical protein
MRAMADTHVPELVAFLHQALVEHGVEAALDEGFVGFPRTGMAVSAAVVSEQSYETHATVQLDVRFDIGPGRTVVESCGGIGADLPAALADAQQSFLRGSFHVLAGAFCGAASDQVTEERWELRGGAARVVIGNLTGRGTPPAGGLPHAWFSLVEAALREAPLSVRTHWLRVYCARSPDGDHTTEVLLDNEAWPLLAERLAAWPWPGGEEFYSARVFLVVDRGFDTARAVPVIAQLSERPDEEIIDALVALGAPRPQAIALCDFLPCAFGRPVLAKMGISASEEAELHEGDAPPRTVRLRDDAVFADALALAEEAYAHGTIAPDLYRALVLRSAELQAVHQALQGGAQPADLTLSMPIFAWP